MVDRDGYVPWQKQCIRIRPQPVWHKQSISKVRLQKREIILRDLAVGIELPDNLNVRLC